MQFGLSLGHGDCIRSLYSRPNRDGICAFSSRDSLGAGLLRHRVLPVEISLVGSVERLILNTSKHPANKAHALDAAILLGLHFRCHWRRASDVHRSAKE
jgi:hypothetical protein